MDSKVKFLRGTATEYAVSTKDNDTFYYTTDTKKLYLGETEITGIEIDDSSTTATDKTWSAKKISDSIPTSLPANGGNADTLDGLHASDIQIDAVSDTAEMVTLDSLQDGVPFSSITVSGKNLIDLTDPTASQTEVTADGGSDSLNVSYSSTARAWTYMAYRVAVKPNTVYHIKCTADEGSGVSGVSVMQSDNSAFSPSKYQWGGSNFDIAFNSGDNNQVFIRFYSNASSTAMTESSVTYHNIMLSEDENAEYVPEIIGQEITLTSCGKNLLKYPYVKTTSTINGITFTDNGDGSITMNGTAAATTWYSNVQQLRFQKGKQYCFSTGTPATTGASPTDNGGYTMYLSFTENAGDSVVKRYEFPNVGSENIVFTANYNYANLSIRVENGAQLNNVTFKPQLEIGGAATEYEPYSGSTVTITPDSNPYTVPNDIRQQEGINNVSVSAGEVTVTGVRRNAAMNRAWKVLDKSCGEGLLRNSNFRINQREVSGTITDTGYFLDCWQLVSGSVTVNSDGTITLNGTIKQILENDPGENVTASASAGTAVYNRAAKTFMLSAKGETVAWAKLEYGDIATPYFAPEYMTELYRCRRYFQRFRNTDDHFVFFGTGLAFSASQGFAMIPLFAPLRSAEAHTAVLSGTLYCTNDNAVGTTAIEITEITGTDISEKAGTVSISFKASGLTKSTPLMIQFRDTSSYLDISSEL